MSDAIVLADKTAVVTGASSGIGRAIAEHLAQAGAHVFLAARDADALTGLAQRIEASGGSCTAVPIDLRNVEQIANLIKQATDSTGRLDIMVNNAGLEYPASILEGDPVEWRAMLDTNVLALLVGCQQAVRAMRTCAAEGHIVNIASASALIALPNAATYASSKWAVLGFTDSLREELELTGRGHVGVSAICPSYISTGMFEGAKAPLLTPILTPEGLAAKIVRCVKKSKSHLLTPGLVRLIPLGKATWPRVVFRRLLRFLGVYQGMEDWKGHKAAPAEPPKKDEYIRVAG